MAEEKKELRSIYFDIEVAANKALESIFRQLVIKELITALENVLERLDKMDSSFVKEAIRRLTNAEEETFVQVVKTDQRCRLVFMVNGNTSMVDISKSDAEKLIEFGLSHEG